MSGTEVEAEDTAGYQRLVNPAIVGPGQWYTLHSLAAFCDTNPSKYRATFAAFLADFISKIRCEKCKNHATLFLAQHPIDPNVRQNQQPLDMFKWTWFFHNKVNERLQKSYVSWEDAVSIFVTNNYLEKQYEKALAEGREVRACTADCEGSDHEETATQVAPTAATSRATLAPRPQPSLAAALSNLTAWASSPSLGPTNGGKTLFGESSHSAPRAVGSLTTAPRNFPPPLTTLQQGQQNASGAARQQPLFSPSNGATITGAGFITKRNR